MTIANRLARFALPIAVLAAVLGNSGPLRQPMETQAAGGVARFASPTYGYSLLIPSSWVHVAGVHWTPEGAPADLTVMTPDHQAALGVLVVPTGTTTYADSRLLAVAIRLLSQENEVLPRTQFQTQRMVINGIPFETAAVYRVSGNPYMGTYSSVAVTQRHHRLYAIAAVDYVKVATLPPPGGVATPTPTPDGFGYSQQSVRSQAVPTIGPAMAASEAVSPAGVAGSQPAAAPVPLSTDRLRGNQCPAVTDAGLITLDKNCAYPAERQAQQSMLSSFTIDPQAPDDSRPAATIGPDGFALYTDNALGFTVAVPAQWAPISLQGTALAVRSPDQNALDVVEVETSATVPSESDLQAAARSVFAQVGTALDSSITYSTTQIDGALTVLAVTPLVRISKPNFGSADARASVVVAAYHHRIYAVLGAGVLTQSTIVDSTPVIYPFFSPFTVLARGYQIKFDTHNLEAGLASQAVLSLIIDPQVAAPQ